MEVADTYFEHAARANADIAYLARRLTTMVVAMDRCTLHSVDGEFAQARRDLVALGPERLVDLFFSMLLSYAAVTGEPAGLTEHGETQELDSLNAYLIRKVLEAADLSARVVSDFTAEQIERLTGEPGGFFPDKMGIQYNHDTV